MIKCYLLLRKKPEISKEEFHRYWKETHAPIVARLPGLVKYTQHHVVSMPRGEYESVDAPYDGVVETWWESEEAIAKVQQSDELKAVLEDELNFMGRNNHYIHTLLVTESVEVI